MAEESTDDQGLQESIERITDKLRMISKKIGEMEREIKELSHLKHGLEARIRALESEDMDVIKKHLYEIDSKVRSLESEHDKRKASWNLALNFAVQLAWVSMAAWLLAKLGLQAPI